MAVAEALGFRSAGRMHRMDKVHVIRHQVLVEGRSRRQVAKAGRYLRCRARSSRTGAGCLV